MEQHIVMDQVYHMGKKHQVKELSQYLVRNIGPAGAILIQRFPKEYTQRSNNNEDCHHHKVPHPSPRID